jgi:phosphomannomutase
MTLIKSISGLRGTIGGKPGENLTPLDIVKFTSAYGQMIRKSWSETFFPKVVVGRDARISGEIVYELVIQTLLAQGIDVVDLGLSTTPTVEFATVNEIAQGGIILTASHNPSEWNALKLLNDQGECFSAEDGKHLLELVDLLAFDYATVDKLGNRYRIADYIQKHIEKIKGLGFIDADIVRKKKLKVVVDSVHSTGGISVPPLLRAFGVEVVELYSEPHGRFPHDPEPLEKNLGELMKRVVVEKANFGIAVDPDVDRLAFVDENGVMFGEEYTLVACADFILSKSLGPCVSNLSSTRALRDIANHYGVAYYAAAVGEVNVVNKMKQVGAVIGGEGNGGVIYPDNHYGRDALMGIALFLMLISERNISVSALRKTYTSYYMAKEKVILQLNDSELDIVLGQIADKYAEWSPNCIDGVKIDFEASWVHLRKSNTEPIIRIYTEAKTAKEANALATRFIEELSALS